MSVADEATVAALRAASEPVGPQTSVVTVAFPSIAHLVDRRGAEEATRVVLEAAKVISGVIRSTDYSFKSEDHAFEVVLADCGPDDAKMVALRIKMAIEMAELAPAAQLPVVTSVVTTVAA